MSINTPIKNRCSKLPLTAPVPSTSLALLYAHVANIQLDFVCNQIEFTKCNANAIMPTPRRRCSVRHHRLRCNAIGISFYYLMLKQLTGSTRLCSHKIYRYIPSRRRACSEQLYRLRLISDDTIRIDIMLMT